MTRPMSAPRVLDPPASRAAHRSDVRPHVVSGRGRRDRPAGTMERLAATTVAVTFVMQFAVRPSGPGNSSLVDVFTLLSIITVGLWAASGAVRLRVPYGLGAGLMMLGGALAGLVSLFPAQALLAVVQDVVLLAWCTAVVAVARRPGGLRLLGRAWAYSAIGCAAALAAGNFANIPAITGVVSREGNRVMFTFGDPNYAAAYWVMSIFVLYATGVPRRRPWQVVAYLLLLWAVLLSESNGAWVELAMGWLLVLAVNAHRRLNPVGATTVVLVATTVAAAALMMLPSVQTAARTSGQPLLVNSLGRSSSSSAQRSVLVVEALELYQRGSTLGIGPASTKPLLTAKGYPYAKEAHNDLLASLVERGPLGLLGLLVLVSSAAYRAAIVLRAPPPQTAPSGSLPRPVGLVGAASMYYEVLHFRFFWGLLAFVAAAAFELKGAGRGRAHGEER
jgi:O-antigen ligase/polysaccharide polymerase Wzy-like membrane protein